MSHPAPAADPFQRADLLFQGADGTPIHAWHFTPQPNRATGAAIIMAHGIGATKQAGLQFFAQRFAQAGHHVVVIDYRHWGQSGGQPRDWLSMRRQQEDYRTALRAARLARLAPRAPQDRIRQLLRRAPTT